MSAQELLPCPFCGSRVTGTGRDGEYHLAYCCQCGVEMSNTRSRQAVVDAWNRRASIAEMTSLVEAVKAFREAHNGKQ